MPCRLMNQQFGVFWLRFNGVALSGVNRSLSLFLEAQHTATKISFLSFVSLFP